MRRLVRKRDTRSRHNEAKYKILSVLYHSKKYMLPRTIAQATGFSEVDIRSRLYRLNRFGYIWRRKCSFKGENGYLYRYLKPMGIRVFMELDRRMKIQEVTGTKVSLKWKESVPVEATLEYQRRINR